MLDTDQVATLIRANPHALLSVDIGGDYWTLEDTEKQAIVAEADGIYNITTLLQALAVVASLKIEFN